MSALRNVLRNSRTVFGPRFVATQLLAGAVVVALAGAGLLGWGIVG